MQITCIQNKCPCPGYTGFTIKYYFDEPAASTYPIGQRTRMVDNSGTTTWLYDTRGRKTQEDRTISANLYTTKYSYTSADQVKTMVYPGGEIVTMSYNNQGQPRQMSSSQGGLVTDDARYDEAMRLTQMHFANGPTVNQAYYPWTTPDMGGRLSSKTAGSYQNLAYQYDKNGNITQMVDG